MATKKQKKLRITLIKSTIGNQDRAKRTALALGLNKVNAMIVQPDNPSVRGMIDKINHLVKVEEITE